MLRLGRKCKMIGRFSPLNGGIKARAAAMLIHAYESLHNIRWV